MMNLYFIQFLKFIIDNNCSYSNLTFLLNKKKLLLKLHINIIFLINNIKKNIIYIIFLNML